MLKKTTSSQTLHSELQTLLSASQHIGFIFSERLINMPVQVVPPMYRMLSDEIKWANDEVSGRGTWKSARHDVYDCRTSHMSSLITYSLLEHIVFLQRMNLGWKA